MIVIYKTGDWVFNKKNQTRGFIVASTHHASVVTYIRNGHFVTSNSSTENLEKLDEQLQSDELMELMDMALELRDREWFRELTVQIGKAKECAE